MTLNEIYAIPANANGWRVLPNDKRVKFGVEITWNAIDIENRIGEGVRVGDYVRVGDDVCLGDYVRVGENVRIGEGVHVGDYVRVGEGVHVGDYVRVGEYVRLGDDVCLGDKVCLGAKVRVGDNVRLEEGVHFEKSPLAVQGTKHLACQSAPGVISIGCQTYSFSHWTDHVLAIARQNRYTAEQGLEYQRIVAFIVANGIPPQP